MSQPVRVKICGITNREDAEAAIEAGADALGFNLYTGSKRCISLEENADWICGLPPFVTRVAVLVNAPFPEVLAVAQNPAIDLVQLHGDEDAAYGQALRSAGFRFIKAVRVTSSESLASIDAFGTSHILLDAHVPGEYGGTGAQLDLSLASALVREHPHLHILLAGGLTPENVRGAIASVRPYAVDVASGVEWDPRQKNAEKMRAFVAAAR